MNTQISCVLSIDHSGSPSHAHRLIAVSEQRKSGLVLCKAYHAEFAGPGAVISTLVEQGYTEVIAIGSPEIIEVATHEERQKAYSRRIQWLRWLHKMTDHPDPTQRAERLFYSLEAFFGRSVLTTLSDRVLALLVGVLPQTIATVRLQHRYPGQFDEAEPIPLHKPYESDVLMLDPAIVQLFPTLPTPFTITPSFLETMFKLPCSA